MTLCPIGKSDEHINQKDLEDIINGLEDIIDGLEDIIDGL